VVRSAVDQVFFAATHNRKEREGLYTRVSFVASVERSALCSNVPRFCIIALYKLINEEVAWLALKPPPRFRDIQKLKYKQKRSRPPCLLTTIHSLFTLSYHLCENVKKLVLRARTATPVQ
jgi:hypothetical protein